MQSMSIRAQKVRDRTKENNLYRPSSTKRSSILCFTVIFNYNSREKEISREEEGERERAR